MDESGAVTGGGLDIIDLTGEEISNYSNSSVDDSYDNNRGSGNTNEEKSIDLNETGDYEVIGNRILNIISDSSVWVERPKSANFTIFYSLDFINKFSGFRSLCIILFLCM